MKKRIAALFAVLIICISSVSSVSAASKTIEPYWIQLLSIACSLEENNGWFSNTRIYAEAKCKSTSYNAYLTVTIQKKSGSKYIDTDSSWTAGPDTAAIIDKKCSLDPGNYIAHCVAVVTDSSGHIIETITKDSSAYIVV